MVQARFAIGAGRADGIWDLRARVADLRNAMA